MVRTYNLSRMAKEVTCGKFNYMNTFNGILHLRLHVVSYMSWATSLFEDPPRSEYKRFMREAKGFWLELKAKTCHSSHDIMGR